MEGEGEGVSGVRGGEGIFGRRMRGVWEEEGVLGGGDVGESECDKEGEDDDEGAWDEWVSEGNDEKGEEVADEVGSGDAEVEQEEDEEE